MERIWFPVFIDVNSGNTLKVDINEETEVGTQYNIVHLHRTKITVIQRVK